jgi:hypothetical protein
MMQETQDIENRNEINQLYLHLIENISDCSSEDNYNYLVCRYVCCMNIICFFFIITIIAIIVTLIFLMHSLT